MTITIALRITLLLMILGAGYVFWLRPLLRQRPGFKELYDREEGFFATLGAKFAGLKQKLTVALVTIAGVAIEAQDMIVPMFTGVDTTSILDMIPPKAWPFIMIGFGLLLAWFRRLAENRGDLPTTEEGHP